MTKLSLILILTLGVFPLFSQSYQRRVNENLDSFACRILNVKELPNASIETKVINSLGKNFFAFLLINSQSLDNYTDQKETCMVGYYFSLINENIYTKALIDTFHEDGGEPRIDSVFYVNADKDKEMEIAILVRTDQIHKGAGVYGNYFDTYFYDQPNLNILTTQLTKLKTFMNMFTCFEGNIRNKSKTCKFKDVSVIRATLKRMGY